MKVNEALSRMLGIKHGVPQGSILGPLLFIIYINDLCNFPHSPKFILYADRWWHEYFFTTSSLTQTQNIVNAYLKQLSVWLHINKLQLNAKKNKYIIFAQINKPMAKNITIIFLGTKIERVKTEKFLGMWFQENLSWNTNVEN